MESRKNNYVMHILCNYMTFDRIKEWIKNNPSDNIDYYKYGDMARDYIKNLEKETKDQYLRELNKKAETQSKRLQLYSKVYNIFPELIGVTKIDENLLQYVDVSEEVVWKEFKGYIIKTRELYSIKSKEYWNLTFRYIKRYIRHILK